MTFPGPSDPMDTQEADAPRPQRRRRLVLLAVVVTVAVVAGTWWLARSVQSPAQRDAAAAPPTVQPVTVAVASGDLHDEITAAATVVQTETQTVTLPLADGRSVVSRQLVAPGQQLRAGQVLLHVNGRPLIALPGAFPAYRDLVQGDQGDDVVQLQQALASLGYNVRADGDFGAATASALRNLYTDLGYSVPTTTRQAGGTEGDGADATQRGMSSSGPGAQERKDAQAGTATQTTLLTLPQAEVVYVPSLASCPVVTELPAQGQVLDAATAVMTVAGGSARVEAQMPKGTADTLSVGTRARAVSAAGELSLALSQTRLVEQDTAKGSEAGAQQAAPPQRRGGRRDGLLPRWRPVRRRLYPGGRGRAAWAGGGACAHHRAHSHDHRRPACPQACRVYRR